MLIFPAAIATLFIVNKMICRMFSDMKYSRLGEGNKDLF